MQDITHRNLEQLRQEIDKTDVQLIHVLAQRQQLVKEVGEFKKRNNVQILQTGRWQEVVKKVCGLGKTVGLSEEFITTIWERIHQESLKVESETP